MNSVVKSALILVAIVAVLSLGFTFSGFQLSSWRRIISPRSSWPPSKRWKA